jgi:hypothetical protein
MAVPPKKRPRQALKGKVSGIVVVFGILLLMELSLRDMVVPNDGEGLSARRMNACLASCLITLSCWILAFYNHHLTFYGDYFGMLKRVLYLFGKRFLCNWPPRPLAFFYVPSFFVSVALAWRAFNTPPDLDNE